MTIGSVVQLPPSLRTAMTHPVDCLCSDCVTLIDIGSDHRFDCRCEVCARWWEALGPEIDE